MATAPPAKLTREERKAARDLQEARKAGTAEPERDSTGKMNPHMPDFLSKSPWYMSTGENGLQHHAAEQKLLVQYDHSAEKLKDRYQRGKAGPASKAFRAGACTNCGAMSHTAKNCLERPRKQGARWTGKAIVADEILHNERAETYDSKRDRWDGYDPSAHRAVIEEYEAIEQARQKRREEEVDNASADIKEVEKVAKRGKVKRKKRKGENEEDYDSFGSSDSDDANEEDAKYADTADQAGQKLDTKNRVTVRNLRIREDTAKYLRNLDIESAHYDPKSRSMREAPDKNTAPEDAVFAGDNFQRMSGEANDALQQQLFAWASEARGQNVHVTANPTQAALVHKEFLQKREELKGTTATSMLDKYGGAQYLKKPPAELMSGQTEHYVEYSRTGQVLKGQERAKHKSKYDEDVFPGNHQSIWGSWWKDGKWGYACCHAMTKLAYCAGQAGIDASNEEAAGRLLTGGERGAFDPKGKRKAEDEPERASLPPKRRIGDVGAAGEVGALDRDKLAAAMRAEDERRATGGNMRGKKYAGAAADQSDEVTEEAMEAHRRKRENFEDPMRELQGDELLPM